MKQILVFISLLLFISCNEEKEKELSEQSPSDKITFTKQKMDLAGIQTDYIDSVIVSDQITCTGRIKARAQNRASISVPFEGFINKIIVREGQYVNKNSILLYLQHPEYIELQKLYLQNKADLELFEKEYQRQKSLNENGAGTGKVYEQVLTQYEKLKVEIKALELKLELLNINANQISSGNIIKSVPVLSPVDGIINELDVSLGQFIKPEDMLMNIIGNNGFFLELDVFEKDINKIEKDQIVLIDCNMPESNLISHSGYITHIGNMVDDMSKTFKVIAEPSEQYSGMRQGIFLNAKINVSEEKMPALPENSIVNEEDRKFVFIAQSDTTFVKQYVTTGINSNGLVAIVSPNLIGKRIVVEGTNYLKAELESE
jgi:cobalt-zinc-cadmium efflux system membrane fusion protein